MAVAALANPTIFVFIVEHDAVNSLMSRKERREQTCTIRSRTENNTRRENKKTNRIRHKEGKYN